jgi:hypothetical protein
VTEHLQAGQHLDAERLGAFAEGATSKREREEMLAHMAECAECRELVFLMQRSDVAVERPPAQIRTDGWWQRRLMPLAVAGAALACGLTASVFVRSHRAAQEDRAKVAIVQAPQADNASGAGNSSELAPGKKPGGTRSPKVVPESRATVPLSSGKTLGATHGALNGAIGGPIPRPDVELHAPIRAASPASGLAPSVGAALPAAMPAESADQKATEAAPALPVASTPFNTRKNAMRIEHDRGPDNEFSEVSGIVSDASGAVVSGATVSVRNPQGATAREMKTGVDGRFAIADLPAGHYELSVAAPGFERTSEQIDLKPRDLALLNSVLQVGASTETVAVMASPGTLETSQAEVSAAIAGAVIKLPGQAPALSTATNGKQMLSVDAAGKLFLSTNAGKSWKKVKPQWQGKVATIVLTPAVDSGGSIAGLAAEAARSIFELTTESGTVWVSADGAHWRQR